MEIAGRYIPRTALILVAVLILAAGGGAAYLLTKSDSGSNSAGGDNDAATLTLETAATQAPTIATGQGAESKVTGFKLNVSVSPTPEIQDGSWAVSIAVQGGKNRSQTLGTQRLEPGKPFVISNNANGAYTITPSILNCAKGCGPDDTGYTLPPLTVPSKKNAQVIVTAKCVKSPLPTGIDCSRSQVLASYK